MDYIVQFICSFLATASLVFVFNMPKNATSIIYCGLVGAIGWMVYYVMTVQELDAVPASFGGAFVIAIFAHILAKRFKMPMLIFIVAGIIPLVPGGIAYNAMRHVVENNYTQSIEYAVRAGIITGAIVMGLVFAEVFMQLIFNLMRKNSLKKQ